MPTINFAIVVGAIFWAHIPKVDATLDIPAQLYPDRLIESNSFVGTYLPLPKEVTGAVPGTAKEIKLACLNSVAPPPFNYKMRCPDTAKMYEWFDKAGVYHRRTEHAPIPGVTRRMAKWWLSPNIAILSPLVNCMGKKIIYWYKCWHPIDHIAVIPFPGVNADNSKLPGLFVRVWEHYRRAPNETVNEFELNMPMQVADPAFNVQIKLPIPGASPAIILGAFNNYVEDTDKGLKVITEFLVGSNNPSIDFLVNLLSDRVIRNQFYGLADQVVRHNIEEYGNFEQFLPDLYAQYRPWDPQG